MLPLVPSPHTQGNICPNSFMLLGSPILHLSRCLGPSVWGMVHEWPIDGQNAGTSVRFPRTCNDSPDDSIPKLIHGTPRQTLSTMFACQIVYSLTCISSSDRDRQ